MARRTRISVGVTDPAVFVSPIAAKTGDFTRWLRFMALFAIFQGFLVELVWKFDSSFHLDHVIGLGGAGRCNKNQHTDNQDFFHESTSPTDIVTMHTKNRTKKTKEVHSIQPYNPFSIPDIEFMGDSSLRTQTSYIPNSNFMQQEHHAGRISH